MGLCTSSYKGHAPKAYDPIAGGTGGRVQRGRLFSDLDALRPQLRSSADEAAAAARSAANDPALATLRNYANRTLAGDYLKTPQALLDVLARNRVAGGREAANAAAGVRDMYARNGMAFSTANQQAQQSAQAAATARANDTDANAVAQHYQAERQNMQSAPGVLQAAVSAPYSYLSQVPKQLLEPLAALMPIIQGLTSSAPQASTYTESQPVLNQITSGIGSL